MKHILKSVIAFTMTFFVSALALADATYPYTNPTYIPTAVSPAATYSAPADYSFQANGISVATVRITGTCTSLAATVQGSNDGGTNWTDLVASSVSGGSSTVSISSTGFWKVNAGGFNKLRVHATALTASCTIAMAGTQAGSINADPCSNPAVMKSSVAVNQGASATTAIVAAATGKSIYACGFVATGAGTNPTFTWTSGTRTSADCDTTAALLSGAFVPSATVGVVSYNPGMTAFKTAASFQLCLTTAATTSVQGVLTYVQQ